jgi:hypothetical protein
MNVPAQKAVELKYYTLEDRIFVNFGSWQRGIQEYQINDKPLEPTHLSSWFAVMGETEIKSLSVYTRPKTINIRYEIIDPVYVNDKVPAVIPVGDVWGEEDRNGNYEWTNPAYAQFQRLYNYKSDLSEPSYEPIEFTATCVGVIKVEDVTPVRVTYKINVGDRWKENLQPLDLAGIVQYSDLDRIIQNPLYLHHSPCSMTSLMTYNLIRSYIKDNIDPKVAAITSDYDFCFTVVRKIKIKPYVTKHETKKANGRSYAKPKIRTYHHEHKTVESFEMTHESSNYRNYTPIKGFRGESLSDLAENIKLFVDELMEHINTPLTECEHCSGCGVIVGEQFPINVRPETGQK